MSQLATSAACPLGSAFHCACLSRPAVNLLAARLARAEGGNGTGTLSRAEVCGYCGWARGRVNGGEETRPGKCCGSIVALAFCRRGCSCVPWADYGMVVGKLGNPTSLRSARCCAGPGSRLNAPTFLVSQPVPSGIRARRDPDGDRRADGSAAAMVFGVTWARSRRPPSPTL